MKTILLGIICFMSYFITIAQSKGMDKNTLLQKVQALLNEQKGKFAIAYKDLQTGESLYWNEHEIFHAASTMKTPVMIEVYKQVALGRLSLDDSVEIKNAFRSIVDSSEYHLQASDDSEQTLYTLLGKKRALSFLVYHMIIESSNLATNMIIEMVGGKKVTQTMRDLGANEIQVMRGVEDTKAFEKGWNNTTSAYDLALIFEKMALGQIVSANACNDMIRILLDQKFGSIIPALLPKEVKVAHKTGSITGVHHDSGIVILPDGRKYVLVILSKNLEDEPNATSAMAKVSALIYQFFEQKR